MLRQITYRTALNGFIFTGLWLVIGGVVLWSPIPGALGIGGALFTAWLLLFFAILALAGAMLTAAALNAAFPPASGTPQPPSRPQRRQAQRVRRPDGTPLWAPPARPQPSPGGDRSVRRDG